MVRRSFSFGFPPQLLGASLLESIALARDLRQHKL
jgi:hypothetical protein